MSEERQGILALIEEARTAGVRLSCAYSILGITGRTHQRWSRPDNAADGRLEARHATGNKLSELERQRRWRTRPATRIYRRVKSSPSSPMKGAIWRQNRPFTAC